MVGVHQRLGPESLHRPGRGHGFDVEPLSRRVEYQVVVGACQVGSQQHGQRLGGGCLCEHLPDDGGPGHSEAAVVSGEVVDRHAHPGRVHADLAHASHSGEHQDVGSVFGSEAGQDHVVGGEVVHVPGLTQHPRAFGPSVGHQECGAVVLGHRGGKRPPGCGPHGVHEVGEPAHHDRFGGGDACRGRHGHHLGVQPGRERLMGGKARLGHLQHRTPLQRSAAPQPPGHQPHPVMGVAADLGRVGASVGVAHGLRRTGQIEFSDRRPSHTRRLLCGAPRSG